MACAVAKKKKKKKIASRRHAHRPPPRSLQYHCLALDRDRRSDVRITPNHQEAANRYGMGWEVEQGLRIAA